ncbi:MAG: hypothetical protein EXQ59_04080 [Acidobacteria bacterium]|nr:hypothetical protein [Acidobacteriota bacterium]
MADCVVITLSDDVQVAVPTWMLDPLACAQLTDEARPRISVSALRDLRAVVDSQPVAAVALAIRRGTVPPIGGEDARPDGTSTTPANADLGRSRPVQRLSAPDRLRCQTLCGQLLRAVLHADAPPRSDDERETPPHAS